MASQLERKDGWRLLTMQLKERMAKRDSNDAEKGAVPLREFQKYDSAFATYLTGTWNSFCVWYDRAITLWGGKKYNLWNYGLRYVSFVSIVSILHLFILHRSVLLKTSNTFPGSQTAFYPFFLYITTLSVWYTFNGDTTQQAEWGEGGVQWRVLCKVL